MVPLTWPISLKNIKEETREESHEKTVLFNVLSPAQLSSAVGVAGSRSASQSRENPPPTLSEFCLTCRTVVSLCCLVCWAPSVGAGGGGGGALVCSLPVSALSAGARLV